MTTYNFLDYVINREDDVTKNIENYVLENGEWKKITLEKPTPLKVKRKRTSKPKVYDTSGLVKGKPCKRGHGLLEGFLWRDTQGRCPECIREYQRRYHARLKEEKNGQVYYSKPV